MTGQPPRRCAECGGSLDEKAITHTQPWGDDLYRFEDVPAVACIQCGHVWLSAEVSQAIDGMIQSNASPKKFQSVPVFSFAEGVNK